LKASSLLLIVLLAGLSADCAGLSWPQAERQVYVPPEPPPVPERPVGANEHLVLKGDTVYSIAFRNNLDFRELAKWNGIGPDYLIRPGQVLRLSTPAAVTLRQGDIDASPTDLGAPPPAKPVPLPIENLDVPTPSGVPARKPPPKLPPAYVPPPPPPAPVVTRVDPPPPLTSESGGAYSWQWPVNGTVVRGFNPGIGAKGLDFTGEVGQPVYAAAPGKVVYSGSALKGYGELVIIKHDDLRLSAYGYNRKRLVEEGQMVRGGQTIAELGLGPENRPTLHFEIRERGQPVNPVPYLPPRSGK
jgi:lipoprotein NlpD